ncbi:lysostaphin resistance A-like protein [Haladaptatus sp. CMAA 1911]|uniref:CPBP family intramembrane glutamic endopeptidase n=1 Tax=unclassified Haladaptatus TaxID=2622732 RepID=UPI003754E380
MSSLAFLAILTVSEVGYVLTAWIYLQQWFDERVRITMPTKGQFGWILGSAIVMLAIGAVITMVSTHTGITTGRVDQELLTGSQSTVLILAVLAFIVIAPAEEYFFRGVIQRRMMRSFSTPVAILIGALIFVLPHAVGYIGNIEGIVLLSMAPFSLAIITGILYEKFDNLSIPILCHGIYNATLFMATYFTAF